MKRSLSVKNENKYCHFFGHFKDLAYVCDVDTNIIRLKTKFKTKKI